MTSPTPPTGHPRVRPPAVAGAFYPSDPVALRERIRRSFADAVAPPMVAPAPKALVVPHAGYVYSGPVAASAYQRLAPIGHHIRRVVLLGPSHRVAFRGMALSSADRWATPLGTVPVDRAAVDGCVGLPGVVVSDVAHAQEHSLEVHLPFLQTVLGPFELVPVVVGDAPPHEVAALLDHLWDGPETLVVVSTDLSHYFAYDEAVRLDARTAADIIARRPDEVGDHDACGCRPLRGLLRAALDHELEVEQIDLRNSGDTAGPRDQVVGYGAFALA
ncbi:MAG: AmmeMemoRadiSam system protein B [Acidimicrobiales bacterium]